MKNSFLLLLSLLLVVSCKTREPVASRVDANSATQSTQSTQSIQSIQSTKPPSSDDNLTAAEAAMRAEALRHVKYNLKVTLDEKSEWFDGDATIFFELNGPGENLFLNFKDGGQIATVKINQQTYGVSPQFYSNHRLHLPPNMLGAGENKIEIIYKQKYSNSGHGLHRFQDPEDQRVYLHSQFEAFHAHEVFPCFDQPDIKSTMVLQVTAPKGWEVISTTRESKKEASKGESVVWQFPETPRLSPYLFSLHAGPYAKFESSAGSIPLRLFVRQSLKRFVIPKEWWGLTQAGLKFYGDYFAYSYPFKKYDQVLVPEFGASAMENVAAVTFNEKFIHRSAPTYQDREYLASVLLHEMAHMWFGDLVTLKWWDGLWLNETFATFMSAMAMDQATEFKTAWMDFYIYEKSGAYIQDQLVTTHPIDGPIADTNSAFSNFDAITYGKGAAVIKQLNYYLGENEFRDGIRAYLKHHAYQNTRLVDFMAALEKAAKKNLSDWSKAWLKTTGVDTVEADYECNSAGKRTV